MKALVTGATLSLGMAMIRALAQDGWEILAADGRRMPLGLRSRYAPLHYLGSQGNKDHPLGALIDLIRREKPDVALAVSEFEQVSRHKDELSRYTNILVPDFESFSIAFDKTATANECRALGIACPRVVTEPESAELLGRRGNGIRTKVVVKPNRNVGSARGLVISEDSEVVREAIERIGQNFGKALIQEFIPGNADHMRTVNLIFDRKSRLAAYFTMKKLRALPPEGGNTALGISTHEPELVEWVMPFFEKWRWQGPAEVEIKIDERDGKPKLIEINPRFWAYVGFPVRCGINFPVIAARLALGESADSIGCPTYPAGVKFIMPVHYLKSVASELVRGDRKAAILFGALRDLRGPMVGNNVPIGDPKFLFGKFLLDIKKIMTGRS